MSELGVEMKGQYELRTRFLRSEGSKNYEFEPRIFGRRKDFFFLFFFFGNTGG
jgi:hypothetical protein